MYNDKIKDTILDSLESKTIDVINTTIVLASQGYLVNKNKYIKLNWYSILSHAFKNINILDKEQQSKIETIYNKVVAL